LQLGFVIFWQKNTGTKVSRKMLKKLTSRGTGEGDDDVAKISPISVRQTFLENIFFILLSENVFLCQFFRVLAFHEI